MTLKFLFISMSPKPCLITSQFSCSLGCVCAWKNPVSTYSCVSLDLKTEASIFLHVWFPIPLQHGSFTLDRLKLSQSPAKLMKTDKRPSLLTQKNLQNIISPSMSIIHRSQKSRKPREFHNTSSWSPSEKVFVSWPYLNPSFVFLLTAFFGPKHRFLCRNVEINECNTFGFEFNFEWIAILKPGVFWDVLKKLFMNYFRLCLIHS